MPSKGAESTEEQQKKRSIWIVWAAPPLPFGCSPRFPVLWRSISVSSLCSSLPVLTVSSSLHFPYLPPRCHEAAWEQHLSLAGEVSDGLWMFLCHLRDNGADLGRVYLFPASWHSRAFSLLVAIHSASCKRYHQIQGHADTWPATVLCWGAADDAPQNLMVHPRGFCRALRVQVPEGAPSYCVLPGHKPGL